MVYLVRVYILHNPKFIHVGNFSDLFYLKNIFQASYLTQKMNILEENRMTSTTTLGTQISQNVSMSSSNIGYKNEENEFSEYMYIIIRSS